MTKNPRKAIAFFLLLPLLFFPIENAASASEATCDSFTGAAVERMEHVGVLQDGAITLSYGNDRIVNPYFANLMALSLVNRPGGAHVAAHWMQWYVKNVNILDEDGFAGTIDDYRIEADGHEESLKKADSRDSYAGTFLSLARGLFENGNERQRRYVRSIEFQLEIIAGVIIKEQQEDGLTWALPSYHVKYLLDNCEAYRGLTDMAFLMGFAFHDQKARTYYEQRAAMTAAGIERELWDPNANVYFVAKFPDEGKMKPNLAVWYPDAYAQIFPLVEGVLRSRDRRAVALYERFTKSFPNWPAQSMDPIQPRAAAGYAAALLGDRPRLEALVATIGSPSALVRSAQVGNSAEQAWLVRACESLSRPASKAGRLTRAPRVTRR